MPGGKGDSVGDEEGVDVGVKVGAADGLTVGEPGEEEDEEGLITHSGEPCSNSATLPAAQDEQTELPAGAALPLSHDAQA